MSVEIYRNFANRLRAGETLFTGWVGMNEPLIGGLLARAGFDSVLFDQQHGFVDTRTVAQGIAEVMLAQKPALIRIPVGDFAFASRALDLGAAGVVAPMINSADDARQFASFMKYPPFGDRSWGPVRGMMFTGLDAASYLRDANRFTLAIAMVETREAMAALDDILAVEGIDGVLVGPSDTSIALSKGQRVDAFHPDVDAVLDTVAARCRAVGKIASCFAPTADRARQMAKKGYNLTAVGNDSILLRQAADAALKTARG